MSVGHIYLLKSSNGYFKIGRSVNVERRLAQIKGTLLPIEITLVDSAPVADAESAERLVHLTFAHCRFRGEWFALSTGELEAVLAIFDGFRLAHYAASSAELAREVERETAPPDEPAPSPEWIPPHERVERATATSPEAVARGLRSVDELAYFFSRSPAFVLLFMERLGFEPVDFAGVPHYEADATVQAMERFDGAMPVS